MTDGDSEVDINVESFENLEEKAKQVLNLPQSLRILIKTKKGKLIESKMDIDKLKSDDILNIIPKGRGPVEYTPENLLKKLSIDPMNLVLFTDRDFVTISEINVAKFASKSDYDPKHLEALKEIANDRIAKDQELRDTLDLVQLSKSHKDKENRFEAPTTSESTKTLSKRELEEILVTVKKDYGQIFKLSDEKLEALVASINDDDDMTIVIKQIKAAASRRLRIKRQMKISKEYLTNLSLEDTEKSKEISKKKRSQKLCTLLWHPQKLTYLNQGGCPDLPRYPDDKTEPVVGVGAGCLQPSSRILTSSHPQHTSPTHLPRPIYPTHPDSSPTHLPNAPPIPHSPTHLPRSNSPTPPTQSIKKVHFLKM